MSRTLLVGDRGGSWRGTAAWPGESAEILCLDAASGDWTTPGRLSLLRGGKVVAWSFLGCLEARWNPIAFLAGVGYLVGVAGTEFTVVMPPVPASPLGRNLTIEAIRIVRPDRIAVSGPGMESALPWPIGPEVLESSETMPSLVSEAQRRARWLELFERCEPHTINLGSVPAIGARLGSGERVECGLPGWTEVCGYTLFCVSEGEVEEIDISHALDVSGATKFRHVQPGAYQGLLCAFARQDGEDFGMGVIDSFDPESGLISARSDAVPPAPVRILKFGTLRLDDSGRELGHVGPWTV